MDDYQYTQARPFIFKIGGETIFKAERLGIFYTIGPDDPFCVMMKHGSYEHAKKHHDDYRNKLIDMNMQDLADEARLIDVTDCALDKLNHLINTSALPERYFSECSAITIKT